MSLIDVLIDKIKNDIKSYIAVPLMDLGLEHEEKEEILSTEAVILIDGVVMYCDPYEEYRTTVSYGLGNESLWKIEHVLQEVQAHVKKEINKLRRKARRENAMRNEDNRLENR
jgi:hypothetical protein